MLNWHEVTLWFKIFSRSLSCRSWCQLRSNWKTYIHQGAKLKTQSPKDLFTRRLSGKSTMSLPKKMENWMIGRKPHSRNSLLKEIISTISTPTYPLMISQRKVWTTIWIFYCPINFYRPGIIRCLDIYQRKMKKWRNSLMSTRYVTLSGERGTKN